MNDLKRHRLLHSAGYRYALRADVSGFYPSVYTHTITWALHGKAKGKKRSKNPLLGDRIDQLLRDGQDRQSIGLPIGPDTSHIVAEILGAAIDEIVLASLKEPFSGFRHMDDYYLCFDDQAAAAAALTVLTHALRDFELNINETKTKICSVEEDLESYWSEEIDNCFFSDAADRQSNDMEMFFDKTIRLAKQLGDDNIIKYAVRRSARHVIHEENWKLYEAYLAHVAVSYPSSLPTICEILSTHRVPFEFKVVEQDRDRRDQDPCAVEARQRGLLGTVVVVGGRSDGGGCGKSGNREDEKRTRGCNGAVFAGEGQILW